VGDRDRSLRGRIRSVSGNDKMPFGMAALEGLESSVRNQLHVNNPSTTRLIRSCRTLICRTPTRIRLLLAIRSSFSVRGGYSLHTSSNHSRHCTSTSTPSSTPRPLPSNKLVAFPALYLYLIKHINPTSNQRVKIRCQTNARTMPAENNGYFDSKF
jgi:hypothetical protein